MFRPRLISLAPDPRRIEPAVSRITPLHASQRYLSGGMPKNMAWRWQIRTFS
jgi:hypothetical protein